MSTPAPTRLGSELLPVGTIVDGKFEIVDTIGAGGFARVYKARQLNIERPVALKLLNAFGEGEQDTYTARFLQEAKVAAQIRHPNVVAIYDFGVFNGRPFIVMELLEGYDVKHSLKTFGPMVPETAVQFVADALDALGKGHEKGIVHKDLKPGNIFIHDPGKRSQSLRILDFGIARVQHSTAMTQSQQVLGTPRYYAPEYVQQRVVTPSLDVYQMALILVEMLTAEPLVAINDPFLCMMHHCTGQLPVPVPLWESPLGPVLATALATEHFKRFNDGHTFRDALEQVDLSRVPKLTGREPRCYLRDVQIKGGRVIVPKDAIMTAEEVRRINAAGPGGGPPPGIEVDTNNTMITPGEQAMLPPMGATVHLPSSEYQAVGPLADSTMVTPMPVAVSGPRSTPRPRPPSGEYSPPAPSRLPLIVGVVAVFALLFTGTVLGVVLFASKDAAPLDAAPDAGTSVVAEHDAAPTEPGPDVGVEEDTGALEAAEDVSAQDEPEANDPPPNKRPSQAADAGRATSRPPNTNTTPPSGDPSGKTNARRRSGGGALPFLPKINK